MPNLNLNRVININVAYSQAQAQAGNFGTLLILGQDTQRINPVDRLRYFTDAESVAAAFGVLSKEAQTAAAYFAQTPAPRACYVGRWNKGPSDSFVAQTQPTNAADPLWTALKAITNASFAVEVDKTLYQVKPFTLASVTGVANLITSVNAAFAASTPPVPATAYGDAAKGEFAIRPTNATSSITDFLSAPAAGADISALLRMTSGSPNVWLSYYALAEKLVEAVQACRVIAGDWYGLVLASSANVSDDDLVAVSDLVESWNSGAQGLFFLQTSAPATLSPTSTTDVASRVVAKKADNTFIVYGVADQYLAARPAGKEFSVDYNAANSVIDVCWKTLNGATPDTLQVGQDSVLERKNVNYYAQWGSAQTLTFFRSGRVASGKGLDEIHGLAWFRAAVQAAVFNVFSSAATKVPQTTGGQARVVNAISAVCARAVRAGLGGEGRWDQPGFGSLKQGDHLPNGYYVWSEPLDQQDPAQRQARVLPPVHIALCGAGSIQSMMANVVFQP